MVLDKIDYQLGKELFEEAVLCLEEAKWMFCNIFFRACVYDNSTKSFRYVPPCRETCDLHLRRSKSCQKVVTQLVEWSQETNKCFFREMFFFNCSFYPIRSSRICQDTPLSKQLFFVKNIFSIWYLIFPYFSKIFINLSVLLLWSFDIILKKNLN